MRTSLRRLVGCLVIAVGLIWVVSYHAQEQGAVVEKLRVVKTADSAKAPAKAVEKTAGDKTTPETLVNGHAVTPVVVPPINYLPMPAPPPMPPFEEAPVFAPPPPMNPVPPAGVEVSRPVATAGMPPIALQSWQISPAIPAGIFATYVMQKEDVSFEVLSKRLYNTDKYQRALEQFGRDNPHPQAMPNLNKPQVGMPIFVPAPELLNARYPALVSGNLAHFPSYALDTSEADPTAEEPLRNNADLKKAQAKFRAAQMELAEVRQQVAHSVTQAQKLVEIRKADVDFYAAKVNRLTSVLESKSATAEEIEFARDSIGITEIRLKEAGTALEQARHDLANLLGNIEAAPVASPVPYTPD